MTTMLDRMRSKRAVAIGLGSAALALVVLALTVITVLLRQSHADAQSDLTELTSLRAQSLARPQAEAAYRAALARANVVPGLIHAANAALAEAQLQSEFKSLADRAGAEIRSTQSLPVVRSGDVDQIAVQFEATVPASRLRDLVYAIETHTPYLTLDDASISAPAWAVNDANARDPKLELRWVIRGYRWNAN